MGKYSPFPGACHDVGWKCHSCSLPFSSFLIFLASLEPPLLPEDSLCTDVGAEITALKAHFPPWEVLTHKLEQLINQEGFVANAIRRPANSFQQGGALLRLASPCNQGTREDTEVRQVIGIVTPSHQVFRSTSSIRTTSHKPQTFRISTLMCVVPNAMQISHVNHW